MGEEMNIFESKLRRGSCKRCYLDTMINEADICLPCHEGLIVSDEINKPERYHKGGIDPIGYGEQNLTKEEMMGFYKMNVIKYISRAGKKDDIEQEYLKAQFYMNKIVDLVKDKK